MGLGLKERMARESARKEQRRAEKAAAKLSAGGPRLVEGLARGNLLTRELLDKMSEAVDGFRSGWDERPEVQEGFSLSDRLLYQGVKDDLRGEWMESFQRLVAAMPEARKFRPAAVTWGEWLEMGVIAGMNEEQVADALRVMLVFKEHIVKRMHKLMR